MAVKRGRPAVVFAPEVLAILGTMPDYQIAARMNVCPQTVSKKRREHGIAPYQPDRTMVDFTKPEPLLGLVTDAALARHRGVTRQAITARRAARGITRSTSPVVLAELLIQVHESAKVNGDGTVSIPADLYERIGDFVIR